MKMSSRRNFLISCASAAAPVVLSMPAVARTQKAHAKGATAITQVFGDGVRLVAVALEYDTPFKAADLALDGIRVEGRTVTGVFISASANPKDRARSGRFVIVNLSTDDANAALAEKTQPPAGDKAGAGPGPGRGPGNAGDIPAYDTVYQQAKAVVTAPGASALATSRVENLVVDDFRQLVFQDTKTGKTLRYNLFVPKPYDARKSYPLVLFMHDAGATSDLARTTLFQGLGAVAWASPEDQARRPCFVLAPQYAEIIADDESRTSNALDTTVDLVKELAKQYSIDRKRLYATGQSGGCMMAIAMNIRYPDLFAASFLVAGQWDPALVAPLARQKLWILVSQDDDKAFPGENAITAALEKKGANLSRAVWDGTWSADQFRAAFEKIDAERSPINYVAFRKGTVVPAGQSLGGASGHRNTWRIAYTIAPIREWIFRQRR
jgi:predicted peptidase